MEELENQDLVIDSKIGIEESIKIIIDHLEAKMQLN